MARATLGLHAAGSVRAICAQRFWRSHKFSLESASLEWQSKCMHPGEIIGGRFEILRRAGTGGMGTVFRVLDRNTGLPAALKVLRDPDGGDAARFLNESRLLATLEHPHIVRYVVHGITAAGEPYLVMEWLEGESLAERLERGMISVEETLELIRLVAEALGVAHARGVVHRDIKPSNLFLVGGSAKDVKVLDFGIARQSGASVQLTYTGSILGTPGYMAPEQARGDREIGPAADVFALGCVMFECLAGKPAFQAAHPVALLAKLLFEETPNLRDIQPDVPAALAAFVMRMLDKDESARPADGMAVVSALSAISLAASDEMARSVHSTAITGTERRLVSIVAVMLPPSSSNIALAPTLSLGAPRGLDSAVRRAAVPLGARVEELANGVVVAVLVGEGSPTDQAAAAARCAIWIRAAAPDAMVVLVTGRAEGHQKLPIGQVLERAAALLDKTAINTNSGSPIRIDASTQALLDSRFFVTRELGRIFLHGERRIGEEPRMLLGQASPFVGREREFRNILSLVEDSFEEKRPLAVLVTGGPGMGKSRLRQELSRQIREHYSGVAFVLARADAIGAGSAYGLVTDSLRSSLLLTGGEPLDAQREKVKLLVNVHFKGDEAQRVTEFIGELAGAPFPDDESPRLRAARQNPQLMAEQVQTAYIELISAVAGARKALFILEDLHWGDAPSIKLFDVALRELRDRAIAIVAFARPEVREVFPRLWADRDLHEVRLGPLPRRAATELVATMLGPSVTPERIAAIVERAEGNAFYLEELIRSVAEGREDAFPETVLGMVEARLARLSTSARRILRAASVFGEFFWKSGLRTLLGNMSSLDAELSALVTAEVIIKRMQSSFAGEDEFAFRHALLREGAYAMLTEQDRALGHRIAAEWLERAGELDAMILAEHFERGGAGERAAYYYLQAAEQALRGTDWTAAIARAERGRSCGPTRQNHWMLHAVLCEAATLSGKYQEAIEQAFAALSELGYQFPTKTGEMQPFLGAILSRVIPIVMQTSLEELACLPRCADAEAEVTGRLLLRLSLAAAFGRPELLPVVAYTMVEHTLKHGVSRMSAGAFAVGAIIAILGLQNLELASRLCYLSERHLPAAEGNMAYAIHASSLAKQYLAKPTEEFFANWARGAEIGLREGDASFAEYCTHAPYVTRILGGFPICKPPAEQAAVDYNSRKARRCLSLMYDALTSGSVAAAMVQVQVLMDEAPPEAQARHKYMACAACVSLHVDKVDQAFSQALQAEPYWRATVCLPDLMAMVFTLCLSAALLPERAALEQARIGAHRSRLEKWASFTPEAFRHQLTLVDAAHAWKGSKHEAAEQLFISAINDARENGYLNNEALGQRLLGAFYEEQKKEPLAGAQLRASAETYMRWGAPTCAGAIRQRHPHYFSPESKP